jgi:hypothetical protein
MALLALAVLPRPGLDAEGATSLLAAESLARDGDRLWQRDDRARAREWEHEEEKDEPSGEELGADLDSLGLEDGEPFGGPIAYALFLAPWAALGGAHAALVAQALLLGLAATFAAATLARHVGRAAAWLPAVLVFAGVTAAYVLRLWPEAFLAALLLLAFALARRAHPPLPPAAVETLPDLYPEEPTVRHGRFAPRWLVVGALLGAVASAAPWTLPLLWPAAALVPRGRRLAGVVLLLAGAAAVMAGLAVAGAATAGAEPSPRSLVAGLGWQVPPSIHARTVGWDLAYLVGGRHLGLLFYLSPVILFAVLAGRGKGAATPPIRAAVMWAGAALSVLLLVLLRPFDLAGAPLTIGPRALVPLAAALCLAVTRPPGRWAIGLTCAWAALWLWPFWKSPREPFGPDGEVRYAAPYLAPWSPLETTQTDLRFGSRLRFGRGKLVLIGAEALRGGSVASLPAGKWVELLAGVPDNAPGFWIEGGEQAGNDLPVRGGEVSETIFRPDGGISFLVRPRRAVARHPMPGDSRRWVFYHLSFRLPGPAGESVTIRVRPG